MRACLCSKCRTLSFMTYSEASKSCRSRGGAPSVADRLIAAIAAPFAFNLALLLLWAGLFRWRRGLGGLFLVHPGLLAALVLVPAAVGLVSGIDRLAQFLGHSFFVNSPSDRDVRITFAIWIGLFTCAYLLTAWIG